MSRMEEMWWAAMTANRFKDGSLVIEDDTLDVNGGSTVNLRVKLGARPRSDVTVALSETSALISLGSSSLTFTRDNWDTYQSVAVNGEGNRQEIALLDAWYTTVSTPVESRWVPGTSTAIAAGLVPAGTTRVLTSVGVQSDSDIALQFDVSHLITVRADLTTAFEDSGTISITFEGTVYTFALAGADTVEPYVWQPSNAGDAATLYAALGAASTHSGTLVLRDYSPGAAAISLSASGPPEYDGKTGSAAVTVD